MSTPAWVSYLVQDPSGQWVHTTLWDLPAHTRINVTVLQYDSGSPLRNQQLGQVIGTTGNEATYNGTPESVIDSNDTNGVGHTFTIPTLGISVPLTGISGDAKNPCNLAPCTSNYDHNVITFSFVTPGPGQYPWQCFVPCGRRLPLRQRRTHANHRVHGRVPQGGGMSQREETHHFRRLIGIWAVLAVVFDVVFYFAVGPHVPPGAMSSSASGQQTDFIVLFMIALPVMLAVWVYMAYALIVWRGSRGGEDEPEGGAKARGHFGIQVGWIATTTVIVLGRVRLRHGRAHRAGRCRWW